MAAIMAAWYGLSPSGLSVLERMSIAGMMEAMLAES
jgi:hypothetical protein